MKKAPRRGRRGGGEKMLVKMNITGLDKQEQAAKKVLEHIEAIKEILSSASWTNLQVSTDLKDETASGN